MKAHSVAFQIEHLTHEARKVNGLTNVLATALMGGETESIDGVEWAVAAHADMTNKLCEELSGITDALFEQVRKENIEQGETE